LNLGQGSQQLGRVPIPAQGRARVEGETEDFEIHLSFVASDDHGALSGSGPHEACLQIVVVGQLIS